jgi:hypothetical protein
MSKKNIIDKKQVDPNTVRVTFENTDGHRVYEYKGSSARSIMRGRDPGAIQGGRLVEHRPKKDR